MVYLLHHGATTVVLPDTLKDALCEAPKVHGGFCLKPAGHLVVLSSGRYVPVCGHHRNARLVVPRFDTVIAVLSRADVERGEIT